MKAWTRVCVEPNCEKRRARFGRCLQHARELSQSEKDKLNGMCQGVKEKYYAGLAAQKPSAFARWEYEGNEEELAKQYGGDESNV